MNRIVFTGTGGGRHMMTSQTRRTGGIFVELDGAKFSIDPGPGALVYSRMLGLVPEEWDGILLSHYHIDNSSDANALIDGMKGPPKRDSNEKKDIFVVAEEHCIRMKKDGEYPRISRYHQNLVKNLHAAGAGGKFRAKGLEITATRAEHGEPCVGFFIRGTTSIGFASDGSYYKGQEENFEACDVLVLNVLIPKGMQPDMPPIHMSVDDAIRLVKAMSRKPKIVVMTHFSEWMLRSNLYKQAKILQDATGVRTIFAEDFMELDLEKLETRILQAKF